MKSIPSKQVAPSFSIKDIYFVHKSFVIIGLALCFLSVVGALFSIAAWRISLQIKSQIEIVEVLPLVGSDKFFLASSLLPWLSSTSEKFNTEKINKSILLNTVNSDIEGFVSSQTAVKDSLRQFNSDAQKIEAVQKYMAAAAPRINVLAIKYNQAIKNINKSQAINSFSEYINHLQVIATNPNGIGFEHINRIEVDFLSMNYFMKNIQELSSSMDLNSFNKEISDIQLNIMPLLAQAKIRPIVEELNKLNTDISDLIIKARTLKTSISNVNSIFFIVGSVLFIVLLAGVFMMFLGIWLGMKDFEVRYQRSSSQFRRHEKAISSILNELENISNGDLSGNIPEFEDENLNELRKKILDLIDGINKLFSHVSETSGLVRTSTEALKFNIDFANRNIALQKNDLSNLKSLCDELVKNEKLGKLDLDGLKQSTKMSLEFVNNGSRSLLDSISNTEFLREHIYASAKKVKKLGERSQEAMSIVESLSMFSEKLSILALNAALEADRAGEKGSGFAIIASEIRLLSSQAQRSVSDITVSVQNLQNDTRDSINSIESVSNKVLRSAQISNIGLASIMSIQAILESIYYATESIVFSRSHSIKKMNDTSHMAELIEKSSETVQSGIEKSSAELKKTILEISEIERAVSIQK